MNGQWMGRYSGTNAGAAMVDLDDKGSHYEGAALLDDDNKALPATLALIRTPDKSTAFKLELGILPYDRHSGLIKQWPEISDKYPGVVFPSKATAQFNFTSQSLKVSWITDIGTSGFAELPKSKAAEKSEYVSRSLTWDEFKAYASNLEHRRYIFRGQKRPWRLRTNFHRTGRADLSRFINEDIPTLYRHLSARTRHIFDLRNPDENGAFYNLVQHHGYPTPLLDWTRSPFVSAYFAFHKITNSESAQAPSDEKVRIFVFDQQEWSKDFLQLQNLKSLGPHFSIAEFIAIENERMIPQQALSTVTNVDDIEGYIASREREKGKIYLTTIDLLVEERPKVMRELSTMGISHGSLFPGLDGACEEIKELFFGL